MIIKEWKQATGWKMILEDSNLKRNRINKWNSLLKVKVGKDEWWESNSNIWTLSKMRVVNSSETIVKWERSLRKLSFRKNDKETWTYSWYESPHI